MMHLKDINIEKVEIDENNIRQYKSEEDFMSLAVKLLIEISKITTIISCLYKLNENNEPRKWTRNEAVLGGLMIRLTKLQNSFLDQVCQKRMETAMIILRCLGETLINIKYLLQNSSEDLFKKFIEYSLREEKRLLNKININIKKRGHELPIEKRMKTSIMHSFEVSNFKLEDVNENKYESWEETIYKRAKSVEMDEIYFSIFSLPSHEVHGNWQNLISNHLICENGEFEPNTNWKYPRPQPLFVICILSATIAKLYLEYTIQDCPDRKEILCTINDIDTKVKIVDDLHEKFIQKKK